MAELLAAVPGLRVRLAGKSLPVEKFAAAKAARFARKGVLILPHYVPHLLRVEGLLALVEPIEELLYLWNGFRVLAGSDALLLPILADVEAALAAARAQAPPTPSKGILPLSPCLLPLLLDEEHG